MHLDELAVRVQRARVHAAKGEAVLVLVACELVREARHDLVDLNHLLLATFAAAIATAEARRSEGRLGRTAREPFVSRLARRPKLEVPLAQMTLEVRKVLTQSSLRLHQLVAVAVAHELSVVVAVQLMMVAQGGLVVELVMALPVALVILP